MSEPNFDRMTKDQVIEWFRTADDVSPALASMTPASERLARPAAEIPMVLASIRLPVVLVDQLDSLADVFGVRRSDVIRDALAAYVSERTSPVARDEAEHALDVLRKVVASHAEGRVQAA